MNDESMSLRERTRRAVRKEIANAANSLFAECGYDATTIDAVAEKAGLSQRSIFRYFASKEELVLGKFEFMAEEMLAILQSAPEGEPVWQTLQRMFTPLARHADMLDRRRVAEPMQRIIFETPALFSAYLEKMQHLQQAVTDGFYNRSQLRGASRPLTRLEAQTIVAAAFGCLVSAQKTWFAEGADRSFGETLDQAMKIVGPNEA